MILDIHIDYAATLVRELRVYEDNGDYLVRNDDSSIAVRLRKRSAYPTTFCRQLEDGSFQLGYGAPSDSYDLEFLLITIHKSGHLQVVRDAIITLPIFYSRVNQQLHINNLYEETLRHTMPNANPDIAYLLSALAPHNVVPKGVLVQEIDILTEREQLESSWEGLKITVPPDRLWQTSHEAPPTDPAYFPRVFAKAFTSFAATRLHGQAFAFDASGGLDSATLPFFLSQQHRIRAPLSTVFYLGEQGISQRRKVQQILAYAGSELIETELNLDTGFPLSHKILAGNFYPSYIGEVIYLEPFIRQAENLQARGIKVLTTGIGGDDILENVVDAEEHFGYGDAESTRRGRDALPPFLTPFFRSEYVAHAPKRRNFAIPFLPASSLNTAVNNFYLERDIWPVSPYLQPSLYNFCQGLKPQFRANKNALRAFQHAYKFPDIIYNASKNENFNSFFTQAMCGEPLDRTIRRFAAQSITAQLGYVDIPQLLSSYRSAQHGDSIQQDWLFHIYSWLTIEIHLAHTRPPGF